MRAQGWFFLLAVILVAKINDVFADVRNLLLLAEFCKHDQWEYMPVLGNLWKAILPIRGKHLAPHGQASCPTWASIVPILNPNRSLGLACILDF